MTNVENSDLSSFYNELNKACKSSAYLKVINISNKILSKNANELKAFQCKIVALIHLEKYEECLALIKKSKVFIKDVILEKAYVEYRLNRMNEALKTLEDGDKEDIRVKELYAQVLYRDEKFEESFSVFRQVIRDSQDDYGDERIANFVATVAAASCWQNKILDFDVPEAMYETDYNMACFYLGKGDYKSALEMLDKAEERCKASLEEDSEVTQDEIDEELAPIRVQRAYIYQIMNDEKKANELYQSVVKQRSGDPALLAVAANNIVCINREQNIFDSRKRIKMACADGLEAKLTTCQMLDIQLNQALFFWHINQLDACRSRLKILSTMFPHCPRVALLNAVQLLKEKKQPAAAAKFLEDYWESEGSVVCGDEDSAEQAASVAAVSDRLAVPLTLLQLKLPTAALTTQLVPTTQSVGPLTATQATGLIRQLDALLTVSPAAKRLALLPGLVSLRVALQIAAGAGPGGTTTAVKPVKEFIEKALAEHSAGAFGGVFYTHLVEACGEVFLRLGCAPEAARLLEQQLTQLDAMAASSGGGKAGARARGAEAEAQTAWAQRRSALVARLVSAYARFDEAKATAVAAQQTVGGGAGAGDESVSLTEADTDALESAFLFGAKYLRRIKQAPVTGEQTPTGGVSALVGATTARRKNAERRRERQRLRRRRRGARLPADAQLGTLPDPERWLPRRERQHGRGKRSTRDRRGGGLGRGPQGQATGGTEWDASGRSPKVGGDAKEKAESLVVVSNIAAGPGNVAQMSSSAKQQHRKGGRKGRR